MAKPQKKPKIVYKKKAPKPEKAPVQQSARFPTAVEMLRGKEIPPEIAAILAKKKLEEEERQAKKEAELLALRQKKTEKRRRYREGLRKRRVLARVIMEEKIAAGEEIPNFPPPPVPRKPREPRKMAAKPAKSREPATRFRNLVHGKWVWVLRKPKVERLPHVQYQSTSIKPDELARRLQGKWSHVALILHYKLPLALGEGDALVDWVNEMLVACHYFSKPLARPLVQEAMRICLRSKFYLSVLAHPASRRFHLDLTDAGPVRVTDRQWARHALQARVKGIKHAKARIKGVAKYHQYIQLATAKRKGFVSWEIENPYVWYHNEIIDREYWRKHFSKLFRRREWARKALEDRCRKILEKVIAGGKALENLELTERAMHSFPRQMREQILAAYAALGELPTPERYLERKEILEEVREVAVEIPWVEVEEASDERGSGE